MASDIKVLQVSYSLATGGLERVVLDLAQKGREFGFVSTLAALTSEGGMGRMARSAGIPLHELHKKPGLDWPVAWRLFRLIRKSGADLVHAHNEGAALYSGLAARLARRPLVTTLHGFNVARPDRLLRRSVGGLAARVICVGGEVAEQARDRYGLAPEKLEVIYNGVDLSQFSPDPGLRAAARSMLGLDQGQKLVISVGRLAGEKNYQLLLEAAAAVAGSRQNLKIVLVGDGPEREALAARAKAFGMEDRFILLGERRDVPELLNAADLFALSSLSEGISKSLLEAMAVGLPVVATDVGGNSEVVEDGVTGLLTPSGSAPDLARALSALLDNGERAVAMGEAGRVRAGERFSLEATLKSHARLYSELTGKGNES